MTRRRVRHALEEYPFQLPVVLSLFMVAVVFTVSPRALDHTAISFETRGIIHHLFFHYALLLGSGAALAGMLLTRGRAWLLELVGLALVEVAMLLNFIATIADDLATAGAPANGLSLALRAGVLLGLLVRVWMILTLPPVVRISSDE